MIDMHLNPVATADGAGLTTLGAAEVAAACRAFDAELDAVGCSRAVMVVLSDAAVDGLAGAVAAAGDRYPIAIAVDFRRRDAAARLEQARAAGAAALKFHPYLQKIARADYERAALLSEAAERLGMFVMVCCSYGTRALEQHDGVRLSAFLAGRVRCPIVMSHGGGRQVLDAMLVAADAPQVLLETSFSLPYYVGSSIETDFAFAMRKLGASRWMYGSDAPFVPVPRSLQAARTFFERHGFSAAEVEQILHGTASALLEKR